MAEEDGIAGPDAKRARLAEEVLEEVKGAYSQEVSAQVQVKV